MGESVLTGDDIKRERKARGISQDRLAKLLDMSTRQIVNIESGNTPVNKRFALSFAWIICHGEFWPFREYGFVTPKETK